MTARPLLLTLALLSASSCSSLTLTCPRDLGFRVDPTSTTLGVGEGTTATAEFLGCHGKSVLDDQITWSSADSSIARVDAATGRITGRAPGSTTVQAHGEKYGTMPPITVTVRAVAP